MLRSNGLRRRLTLFCSRSSESPQSELDAPSVRRMATDRTLCRLRSESKDPKLLNISYIISRRATVEVFSSKKSSLGDFVGEVISNLVAGKIAEGLTGLVKGAIRKLLGSSSGSAKTDRV